MIHLIKGSVHESRYFPVMFNTQWSQADIMNSVMFMDIYGCGLDPCVNRPKPTIKICSSCQRGCSGQFVSLLSVNSIMQKLLDGFQSFSLSVCNINGTKVQTQVMRRLKLVGRMRNEPKNLLTKVTFWCRPG